MTVQVSNNLRSDIEKWISDYVGSGKIPFGHVIICDSKDILINTKQGYADISSRQTLDEKYLLRIYSMTKPMVATAFMQLFEQGMVRLEDEITEYLPEFEETRVFSGIFLSVREAGKCHLFLPGALPRKLHRGSVTSPRRHSCGHWLSRV